MARVAGVIAAVILGLPLVDAELALPESLMIAPLSWAGAIVLVRILRGDGDGTPGRTPLWPLGVGLLMAAAISIQQTAVAETSAFFFAMLLAPKLHRRDAFVFLGTVVAITVAWLTAAVITAGGAHAYLTLLGSAMVVTLVAMLIMRRHIPRMGSVAMAPSAAVASR